MGHVSTSFWVSKDNFSRILPQNQVEISDINTQYMRNPDMVYVLKMEYVSKINIFGLKMMVKSGLEKIFFKIPPCEHHVILIKTPLLYEVNSFNRKKFSRPLFTIIFRPKILILGTYSILST